jgi:hypothetical protein
MHYHYAFYEFSRFKTIGKSQDADDLSDRLFFVLKSKSTSYLTFSRRTLEVMYLHMNSNVP